MTQSLAGVVLLTGAAAVVVFSTTIGLAGAARRAGLANPRALAGSVAAALVLWLGVSATLAETGLLGDGTTRPPRWPMLPLATLGTFALLSTTQTFRRVLAEVPPWQPVALQSFRVIVELAFWRLHAEGFAPVEMTFEGRNLDVLVSLSAPVVAVGMATGRIGPRGAIVWNLFGLAMLINAIGTAATTAPGPLRLNWLSEPFAAIATWPVISIPALLAPTGIFLHVASIRQSIARLGPATPK